MDWEFTVLNMMQKYLRSPVLDAITITVSTLGKLGLIWIVMAIICLVFIKKTWLAVIIYSLGLIYSGLMHIITAFRKNNMIYIQ